MSTRIHLVTGLLLTLAVLAPAGVTHGDDYTNFLKEGNRLYAEGKYVEAEENYIQAMNDKPDAAAAYFNIGDTFFAREDYVRAIENFQSALVHARADRDLEIRARYNLATARVKESEKTIGDVTDQEKLQTGVELLQQAISDYRDVLEIDPDHADARHNLTIAQLRIKNLFDTLKKLREQQEQDQEKGQSPVEILKELIKEEEGEIALTTKAIVNATEASNIAAQKAKVDEAQALAEKLSQGQATTEDLDEKLETIESDPNVELGAAEISSARKELDENPKSGESSFISKIGDAVNRLLGKVTALGADRRSTIEKDRADQEATRNKALGFVQALRDRAAGKPPPQPPAQRGQPAQPPPPPPEPLEPEVAKRFKTIADLTSGAADFMTQAVEKLTAAEEHGEEAPAEVLALLEPTREAQTSALEELKKALEEAEKLPKEEQQQQQQQDGDQQEQQEDGEKQEQEQEQEGEQQGEQQEQKEGEEGEEGEDAEQKEQEELTREQAEKLLRKFLEADARKEKDRKDRERRARGRVGIGGPDRDW